MVGSSDEESIPTTRTLTPSIKLPLIKLILALLVGAGIGVLLLTQQPNQATSRQAILTILLVLLGLYVLNKIVKVTILWNTKYIITDTMLKRQFSLAYRTKNREVPPEKIRGVELNKGFLSTLMGYGTIVILTAGPNRSLGFLEYELIPEPEEELENIKRLMITESDANTQSEQDPKRATPING